MHQVVVLGSGKSSTVLIEFLLENALKFDLFLHVADLHAESIVQKTKGHPRSQMHIIRNGSELDWIDVIRKGELVISLLPPSMHNQIAKICLQEGKHFLNASYLTEEIRSLDAEVKKKNLTFLLEMGLDPGIDHMSAMEMITEVHQNKGHITSFLSHCGGLVAPESDDNPWHYKISWNPRNVVLSGKDGATYLDEGIAHSVPYVDIFDEKRLVHVPGLDFLSWYPNRNSIPYIELYGLKNIRHFVRTTLRYPDFITGWKLLVNWKMTSDDIRYEKQFNDSSEFFYWHISRYGSFSDISDPKIKLMMDHLGMYQKIELPDSLTKPSEILQYLMEQKLVLKEKDKDMIVMLHEMEYDVNGQKLKKSSSLVIKGEDQIHTAMARTVGMPLALAAIQILTRKIDRKGVFIPIYEDIFTPILKSLAENGIVFSNALEHI